MNSDEFKEKGFEIIEYISNYFDTVAKRPVVTTERPGFMKELVPLKAPEKADEWEDIMKDMDDVIIPGFSHWAHPHFHAYFPTGCSLASVLGTLLTGAFGCSGSSWSTSPASTELEVIILEWLAKAFDLPKKFLFYEKGSKGGGCLQGSASECTLLVCLAAQKIALQKLKKENPSIPEGELLASLVAYCSKEAHSSVEKACLIAMVTVRIIDTDERFRFRGKELEEAVKQDLKDGLHPFLVVGTLGTTASTSVDKFDEIGPICKKYELWLHVDGAYGISALICPEFRHFANGLEYASSIAVNPHKWLLMHFDCSSFWIDDRCRFVKALSADPDSLSADADAKIIDFSHWGTGDRIRFRALKMWVVMRTYGVTGMQKFIRNHVQLAKYFEELVQKDHRFEVINDVNFGTICFRLKSSNDANAKLLASIVQTRKLFMVPASLGGSYVIRFNISYEHMSENDIFNAWEIITTHFEDLNNI
ncbi:tyrosine decarboxylase-like [Parasteatoda tepidariorum]|uniref:tyrosine decarboxylase-like n=1 Tax=Parasteatoda tepidariorum TaxID=114398 RepID=UPI001C720806|nr:tyrosine decarboxylase-like [Parasteatoda tepidariorum]